MLFRSFLDRGEGRYHLVFMDPPWQMPTDEMEDEMDLLDSLLEPGAEVVVSRRHTDPIPSQPETWRVATDRRYGDTRILRYEIRRSDQ